LVEEMDFSRRRVSRGMLPLLALHTFSEYYRLERKPPVTAGLLAANTLIYLRPAFLEPLLPSIDEVWFNAHLILKVCYFILNFGFLSVFIFMSSAGLFSLFPKNTKRALLSSLVHFSALLLQ